MKEHQRAALKPPQSASDILNGGSSEDGDAPGSLGYTGEPKGPSRRNGAEEGSDVGRSKGMNYVYLLLPIVVSVILALIMVIQYAPSKSDVDDLEERVVAAETAVVDMNTKVTADSTRIDNVTSSYATKSSLGDYVKASDLGTYASATDLESYVTLLELETALDSVDSDISSKIAAQVAAAVGNIDIPEVPTVHSLDYSFVGSDGDFVLTITSDRAGDFVACVTLTYDDPVDLAGVSVNDAIKDFYVNYLDDPNRNYDPRFIYDADDDTWKVFEVTFSTSGFTLLADTEAQFDVEIDGLIDPFDDFEKAYVEILPGSVTETTGEGSSI